MATAAITIVITSSNEYPFWICVFAFKQLNAQPVALDIVWCVPALPGRVEQFVEVCTLPNTWIPIDNRMATPMKVVTNAIMKLEDSILSSGWFFNI